jgi:hypothetical protein
MADPLVAAGQLHFVAGAPRFPHPTYMVYPKDSDNPMAGLALEGLRALTRNA